ncbi:MAG TPA: hypothetical protein VGK29_22685 [Paludibaculum sp.]|jgi:hypothetical protein
MPEELKWLNDEELFEATLGTAADISEFMAECCYSEILQRVASGAASATLRRFHGFLFDVSPNLGGGSVTVMVPDHIMYAVRKAARNQQTQNRAMCHQDSNGEVAVST